MKLDKDIFNKWVDWIEKIKADLTGTINNQQIYNYFIEVVNANLEHIKKNHGVLFCDFVRKCYAVQAAIGVRRHIKTDEDSISLMRLLGQIKKCANQFTYDFYLERYPINRNKFEWQKSMFLNFSKDGKAVSEEMVNNDIQQLKNIGSKVSNFVDRGMAHLDKRGYDVKVTFADLRKSIDSFNKIACKYICFIKSEGYFTLEPTIQFDWQKIFTVPLDIRNNNN